MRIAIIAEKGRRSRLPFSAFKEYQTAELELVIGEEDIQNAGIKYPYTIEGASIEPSGDIITVRFLVYGTEPVGGDTEEYERILNRNW